MSEAYSNLGRIIRTGIRVRARCDDCKATKEFTPADIEALAAKTSYRYSLVDRRCRCRLTPGCDGWNRFDYHMGVWRPMKTDHGIENEVKRDRRARERAVALMAEVLAEGSARKRR